MQGGVYIDQKIPTTKKALKEAVLDDPQRVRFYSTSALHARSSFTLDAMPWGVKLVVVGPNPYRKRAWYATLERLSTGRIHVR